MQAMNQTPATTHFAQMCYSAWLGFNVVNGTLFTGDRVIRYEHVPRDGVHIYEGDQHRFIKYEELFKGATI
jgi:hypothetical protein